MGPFTQLSVVMVYLLCRRFASLAPRYLYVATTLSASASCALTKGRAKDFKVGAAALGSGRGTVAPSKYLSEGMESFFLNLTFKSVHLGAMVL